MQPELNSKGQNIDKPQWRWRHVKGKRFLDTNEDFKRLLQKIIDDWGWSKETATEYIIDQHCKDGCNKGSVGSGKEPSPWGENAVRIIEDNRYNEPWEWK